MITTIYLSPWLYNVAILYIVLLYMLMAFLYVKYIIESLKSNKKPKWKKCLFILLSFPFSPVVLLIVLVSLLEEE